MNHNNTVNVLPRPNAPLIFTIQGANYLVYALVCYADPQMQRKKK